MAYLGRSDPSSTGVFTKSPASFLQREYPSFFGPPFELFTFRPPHRMLFPQRTKGFCIERNDHAVMLARTSAPSAPFVVEEMAECPPNDPAALEQAIKQLQPKKGPSGYL